PSEVDDEASTACSVAALYRQTPKEDEPSAKRRTPALRCAARTSACLPRCCFKRKQHRQTLAQIRDQGSILSWSRRRSARHFFEGLRSPPLRSVSRRER